MLLKTIEFVPSDISLTIASLQTQLDEGKYDDILAKFNFFTITEKGLTLVKQDKTIVTNATVDLSDYVKSSTLEEVYAKKSDIPSLSGYATESFVTEQIGKIQIPDVSNFLTTIPDDYITEDELNQKGYLTEHQSLDDYAKTSDIPDISNLVSNDVLNSMFTIDESGNLVVTINGVTQTYAPITV